MRNLTREVLTGVDWTADQMVEDIRDGVLAYTRLVQQVSCDAFLCLEYHREQYSGETPD